jgi:hypothetical protein
VQNLKYLIYFGSQKTRTEFHNGSFGSVSLVSVLGSGSFCPVLDGGLAGASWEESQIIEINMLEGPEMITIDPDIMNSECRILEAHVLEKGIPFAGSEINDLLVGRATGLRSVKY